MTGLLYVTIQLGFLYCCDDLKKSHMSKSWMQNTLQPPLPTSTLLEVTTSPRGQGEVLPRAALQKSSDVADGLGQKEEKTPLDS